MPRLEIEAKTENLEKVNDFIAEVLIGCPMKLLMQIDLAVEEIFVNIASYAYEGDDNTVDISVVIDYAVRKIKVVFKDSGVRFDPLSKKDPDITLPARERKIGGLGIFMAKKLMDNISYEYVDNKNVLTIEKNY